ncbi:MAG: Wzz/FepE/Etk N-terminal domain-containing protein [Pseudomonadota bacterium]
MNLDIRYYIALLKKRMPVMIVIFAICAALGVGMAMTMPPKFTAEASLSVEGSQISEELVMSTGVSSDDANQLQIIQQKLRSRSNMIDVARKNRVFAGQDLLPDEVVREMRELTRVSLSSGRNRATIMRISFTSENPNISAGVVNDLVTFVLAEDVESRRERSGGTFQFFERRVDRLTDRLAQQSAEIVSFKEANKGALPEELSYRLSRETSLRERDSVIARELLSLREQRNRLLALGANTVVGASPAQIQLAELEAELRWKLSVFSEENPKVKVLASRIEKMREQLATDIGNAESGASSQNSVLELQIAEIDARIQSLEEEKGGVEVELIDLREAIEATPQVGIQLTKLEREYANTQVLYNEAVRSRATAEQGVDVEDGGGSKKVVVIDQVTVPTEPSSPNRVLIAGGGMFVGTSLAFAFFALTELLNRSIRRPVDLARGLGVQPLATLPYLEEESVRRRRFILKAFFLLVVLTAIPTALWYTHTYYLPLDLLFEQFVEKLGL